MVGDKGNLLNEALEESQRHRFATLMPPSFTAYLQREIAPSRSRVHDVGRTQVRATPLPLGEFG